MILTKLHNNKSNTIGKIAEAIKKLDNFNAENTNIFNSSKEPNAKIEEYLGKFDSLNNVKEFIEKKSPDKTEHIATILDKVKTSSDENKPETKNPLSKFNLLENISKLHTGANSFKLPDFSAFSKSAEQTKQPKTNDINSKFLDFSDGGTKVNLDLISQLSGNNTGADLVANTSKNAVSRILFDYQIPIIAGLDNNDLNLLGT